jgi:hypothetical protein
MKEKETLLQETTEKIAELEKEQHRLAAVGKGRRGRLFETTICVDVLMHA